jgi:hypothetical protein
MDPDEVSLNSATRQYKTPPSKMQPDQMSLNSTSSHYKTHRADPEEASVHSMNSLKRNLYNKSPYHTPRDDHVDHPYASNNEYTPKPLEQDEVSAVSMNSVTRNLYNKSSESLDIDHDDHEEEEASASSNSNEHTAQYDAKGKCLHHPTVRLRKKKLFGGWQIILSNCPECCLDEMRRVKEDRSRSGKSKSGSRCGGSESGSRVGKSKSSKSKKNKKREKQRHNSKEPPMSQIHLASNGEDDKSIGTASTITISSYTASLGKGRMNWQDFTSNEEETAGPACVTRMPYIDHLGERGWYTGSVDGTTGTPHGFGTMNFSNGATFEGHWRNGRALDESEVNSPAKARYPPQGHGGRRPQHFHHPPPRSPLETHYEDDSHSSSRQRSRPLPQQQQQISPMKLPQHLSTQHHREVVCGMMWTDSTGTGAYTGEVNGLNIPDGVGSMRYNNGVVAEGLWVEGEMEEDANEDVDDSLSYQGGHSHSHSDGFLGRNNPGPRRSSGSASVM